MPSSSEVLILSVYHDGRRASAEHAYARQRLGEVVRTRPSLQHYGRGITGLPFAGATRPNKATAKIVVEIFKRLVDGESERHIAAVLNKRKVVSPGSVRNRKVRRVSGWQGSAINAILQNEAYAGTLVWDRSQWVNDPDTGKRQRKERPESEWHIRRDEEMRIVTPELWAATLRRFKLWKRAHSCGVGEATRAAWAQAPTERAAEVRALRRHVVRAARQNESGTM